MNEYSILNKIKNKIIENNDITLKEYLNYENEFGWSSIHFAASSNSHLILKEIIFDGSKYPSKNKRKYGRFFQISALYGSCECFPIFLENSLKLEDENFSILEYVLKQNSIKPLSHY